ncbi:uncharacterized protein LOC125570328 isoform X1 [Nematostella vectensis]|uniref:uncharacterized protein LOC125570327 n=1 Tax=Nematostella vectensis TaxID=45351 RepID=UPI002077188D|nr:uncharacterized protein LOC125570327 [Nematostella vectensis]XP_048587842.1 uncharacterized protein LOC125570328 isoform X1 [Nematostella vectensis]
MKNLQMQGKPNLVYKWCQCLHGVNRSLQLDRMPFGMIQYRIEFFSCTHIAQISVSPDYKIWLDTMEAEFGGGKFKRLFRGPMWNGCDKKDIGDPSKAKPNIPCRSKQAQLNAIAKSDFSSKPEIQTDGTDVKEALQESLLKVWNGDVDGALETLQGLYDDRLHVSQALSVHKLCGKELRDPVVAVNNELNNNILFLYYGLAKAVQLFRKKFDPPNTKTEKLMSLNWEIVEFNTLLEQATRFREVTKEMLNCLDPLLSMSKDLKESLESNKEKKPPRMLPACEKRLETMISS